jgi:hypothetical protein
VYPDFGRLTVDNRRQEMILAPAKSMDREVLDRPCDPDLVELYRLWETKRGERLMPSRGDFDPSEFSQAAADYPTV